MNQHHKRVSSSPLIEPNRGATPAALLGGTINATILAFSWGAAYPHTRFFPGF